MFIDGVNKTGPVTPPKRKKPAGSGSDFDSFLDDAEAPSVSGPSPMSAINPFLALQEVTTDSEADIAHEKKRGNAMLDQLDELRMGLLTGTLSPQHLSKLKQVITAERVSVSDQVLTDILGAIEVRAAVELAKLEASKK